MGIGAQVILDTIFLALVIVALWLGAQNRIRENEDNSVGSVLFPLIRYFDLYGSF